MIRRHRLPPWTVTVAAIVAGFAIGAAVRYLVVQQPALAWLCGSTDPPWWCLLRESLVLALRGQLLGVLGAFIGLHALIAGGERSARLAMVLGAAGLCLYSPELSGSAFLFGALRMIRPRSRRRQNPPQSTEA